MSSSSSFEQAKLTVLGKRDKSFAGRIDVRAVEICALLNAREEYYTLSSCSGRSFLYEGEGIKATDSFRRYRISHDVIVNAQRYFNLMTLDDDPTGGADPLRSVGQYDFKQQNDTDEENRDEIDGDDNIDQENKCGGDIKNSEKASLWLRMEPFILHVACNSLSVANTLMATARPSFKNVGITSLSRNKIVVAIWGDEGLELPLTNASSESIYRGEEVWLQQLVNERLERNWNKIQRFVDAVRVLPHLEEQKNENDWLTQVGAPLSAPKRPKSYDVIGDIAVLHSLPEEANKREDYLRIGEEVLSQNKALKVCVVRTSPLEGADRASPPMLRLASRHDNRMVGPLLTTHVEYGIPCVVDVEKCFFSPRMGSERLRLTNSVARGEHVLVLFAGVGMEALQFAARTEASRVLAIEQNSTALECAYKSKRMLQKRQQKSKSNSNCVDRLEFQDGNVLDMLPLLERCSFDRIVAPRPKEANNETEGDLGDGTAGSDFLRALLPVLKLDGGECHWYDFVADHEFPTCERTRNFLQNMCKEEFQLQSQIVHIARVGASVAKRQYRVCVDLRLCGSIDEKARLPST